MLCFTHLLSGRRKEGRKKITLYEIQEGKQESTAAYILPCIILQKKMKTTEIGWNRAKLSANGQSSPTWQSSQGPAERPAESRPEPSARIWQSWCWWWELLHCYAHIQFKVKGKSTITLVAIMMITEMMMMVMMMMMMIINIIVIIMLIIMAVLMMWWWELALLWLLVGHKSS